MSSIKMLLGVLLFAFALQGCATPDRRADILYRPVAEVKGGAGDLVLVQGVRPPSGEAAGVQWVLGKVTNKDGEPVSRVVSDMSPAALVADALNQELKRAGYNVILSSMPADPGTKALVLKEVTVRLDETHSVVKDEANCSVKMAVEAYPKGVSTGVAGYEAVYSDTALANREELPADSLQKALQLLMTRAVPDIVKTLEQK